MRIDWRQAVPALLLGALLGLWAGHWISRSAHEKLLSRGPDTEHVLRKFTAELALDAKQQQDFKTVLESYRGRLQALHEDSAKRFDEVRLSMRADLSKLLSPDQQKRFQEMQARWEARHKSWALPPH